MTKTKQALEWIALGRPRSQMPDDLGISSEECTQLINYFKKAGYIESVPVTYSLTGKGKERIQYIPTARANMQRLQRLYYRMTHSLTSEQIVKSAKRQPSSVFRLGGKSDFAPLN